MSYDSDRILTIDGMPIAHCLTLDEFVSEVFDDFGGEVYHEMDPVYCPRSRTTPEELAEDLSVNWHAGITCPTGMLSDGKGVDHYVLIVSDPWYAWSAKEQYECWGFDGDMFLRAYDDYCRGNGLKTQEDVEREQEDF